MKPCPPTSAIGLAWCQQPDFPTGGLMSGIGKYLRGPYERQFGFEGCRGRLASVESCGAGE